MTAEGHRVSFAGERNSLNTSDACTTKYTKKKNNTKGYIFKKWILWYADYIPTDQLFF